MCQQYGDSRAAFADPEGGRSWGRGPDTSGKLKVAIEFLRNTGMDPLPGEAIGPHRRSVWPCVKYVDD